MRIEIKDTKEEVIDWSRPQLVISRGDDKRVIRTNGKHMFSTFDGMEMLSGDMSTDWMKPSFKPFHGTITLSNDQTMQVKIKKLHKDAVIPQYAKDGDAGLDLTAVSKEYDEYGNTVYGVGLAFEIPKGYFGMLAPRSSNAKTDLRLTNSFGVLDSGFRGEVMFKYRNDNYANLKGKLREDLLEGNLVFDYEYKIGDRVGQLIILPYPNIEFLEVDKLTETERGEGGYGSTGK